MIREGFLEFCFTTLTKPHKKGHFAIASITLHHYRPVHWPQKDVRIAIAPEISMAPQNHITVNNRLQQIIATKK